MLAANTSLPTMSKDQETTEFRKQPIRTRYLGNVTGYQPIRDQYFLIRSVPAKTHKKANNVSGLRREPCRGQHFMRAANMTEVGAPLLHYYPVTCRNAQNTI